MKYKPGDEFIITVKSGVTRVTDNEPNYLMDGIFCLYESTLDKLKSLDELKQAEYQRGLADAWGAAWKVLIMKQSERDKAFGNCFTAEIFTDNTPAEAIAKIRAYDEENEIKVGDEVKTDFITFFVTRIAERAYYGITESGTVSIVNKDECRKTGRHFAEVAVLLDKLKEDTPDV